MKINKNIFSMQLFALSFILLLFSCNQPSGTGTQGNGNPEETQKKYPETISTGFEKPSPDTMDFSNLTRYIAAIKNLLQPEEALTPESYREFLSSLQEGLAKIIPQDQDFPYTLLTNEYQEKTPSDIEEKQTSSGYNTEEYNSLYQTFKESLTALNTAYTSYKTAYNDYKSAYEGTPQTGNLSQLKELLKEVIKDFNDDFYFKKETLENTELSRYIEECVKEQKELKNQDQSFCEKETAFLTSMENFQQALSALRAYTPEEVGNIKEFYYDPSTPIDFLTITKDTDVKYIIKDNTVIDFINYVESDGTETDVSQFVQNYRTLTEKAKTVSIAFEDNPSSVKINAETDIHYLKELTQIIDSLNDKSFAKLPTLNLTLFNDGPTENNGNLYGIGLDKIIETYFNTDKNTIAESNKFTFDNRIGVTRYVFDAKEAVNGQTMYTENDYNGNAYNLDINAALLMGVPVKNVEIIGTNKTSKNTIEEVTNVRVSSDVSDITFGAGSGVIDFVNNAPIQTPYSEKGKVIIRSVGDNDTLLQHAVSLDLSSLDSQQINKLSTIVYQQEVKLKDMDSYNIYSVKNFKEHPGVVYVNNQVQFGDNSRGFNATNADWEQAGNDGTLPPQNTANVSQANVKSVKSLVMKRLLDDNQRVYG